MSTKCAELTNRLASLYDLASSLAGLHATGADGGWAFGHKWPAQRMAEVYAEIRDVEKQMHAAGCPFPTLAGGADVTSISSDEPNVIIPGSSEDSDKFPSGDSPWPDPGKGGHNRPKL